MTIVSPCVVRLAGSARGLWVGAVVWDLLVALVRDQVGGALSCAAVPRGGLGPPTPPLCRYAECTTDLISHRWREFHRWGRHYFSSMAGSPPLLIHRARGPGAWLGRRSGIKEECSATSRHGGQPRSRPSQAPGRSKPWSLIPSIPSQAKPTATQPMPVSVINPTISNNSYVNHYPSPIITCASS
jgi:hypothetical protein